MNAVLRCGLVGLLLLGGCQSTPVAVEPLATGNQLPPQGQLNVLADQLVLDLRTHFDRAFGRGRMAVTTPVSLDDFEHSNAFSRQLEQALITSLHRRGFDLVDLNGAEMVRVGPEGNLLLTRDAEMLPQPAGVEQVVTTSISPNATGIHLFMRVLQLDDNKVLATAQSTVQWSQLPNHLRPNRSVILENGRLSRDAYPQSQPIWWQQ